MNQPNTSKSEIAEIVRLAQQGDQKALEQLLKISKELIFNTCFRILKNYDDVEDVVQEVYIIIFQKIHLLKNREAFLSWAAIIASNKCKDYLRTKKTFFFLEDVGQQDDESDIYERFENKNEQLEPEKALDTKETQTTLLECIDNLPDVQRMCIILFYYSELSIKQIASIMSTSEGTIKSRLNYAKRKLASMLEEESHRGFALHGYAPVTFLAYISYFLNKAARQKDEKASALLTSLETWATTNLDSLTVVSNTLASKSTSVISVSAADASMAKSAALLASGKSLLSFSSGSAISVFLTSAMGKALTGAALVALVVGGSSFAYAHFNPQKEMNTAGLIESSSSLLIEDSITQMEEQTELQDTDDFSQESNLYDQETDTTSSTPDLVVLDDSSTEDSLAIASSTSGSNETISSENESSSGITDEPHSNDTPIFSFSDLNSTERANLDSQKEVLSDSYTAYMTAVEQCLSYQKQMDQWAKDHKNEIQEHEAVQAELQQAYDTGESLGTEDWMDYVYLYQQIQKEQAEIEKYEKEIQDIYDDPESYVNGEFNRQYQVEQLKWEIERNQECLELNSASFDSSLLPVMDKLLEAYNTVDTLVPIYMAWSDSEALAEYTALQNAYASVENTPYKTYSIYQNAYGDYCSTLDNLCTTHSCSEIDQMPSDYLPSTYYTEEQSIGLYSFPY